MISRRNEHRIMKYLLTNAVYDSLADPVYPIDFPENIEPDGVTGPVGGDKGLMSLNIPHFWEVVQKLITDGFIMEPQSFKENPSYYEIHFTPKGRYYLENRLKDISDKVIWSIVVPVFVAVLTAWLTVLTLG